MLKQQHGERWAEEDKALSRKLAALKEKHGAPPNIVYLLWDDQQYGSVGIPELQKNLGYETPNINKMGAEGILFSRMYSEPACTPTRAAFLSGRHPVRHGMGVVGMPHEFSGLRKEEVTLAEVLSEAGYATGVPMGGNLPSAVSNAPSFSVWAMRDPNSGTLKNVLLTMVLCRGNSAIISSGSR